MYRIVTIDPEHSGIAEDGFGINDAGDYFVAICLRGFTDDKLALIFTFSENGIKVTQDYVIISSEYKLNDFDDIVLIAENSALHNQNDYDLRVLRMTFDKYLKLSHKSTRKSSTQIKINPILRNILTKVYKAVGVYYKTTKVNLKQKSYEDFSSAVRAQGKIFI
jgi:hypothetical protein